MDDEISGYCFGHGIVQSKNVARVISRFDELASYGSASSSLMMWSGRTKGWHHFNLGWNAVRLACSEKGMFALGEKGHFLKADAGGVSQEVIPGFEEGKSRPLLTDMCIIDDCVWVCGRDRALFKRDGDAKWSEVQLEDGDIDASEKVDISAVHGLSGSDAYAVGTGGAIWRMRGGEWERIKSPTGESLNNVRVADDGTVYVVGANGLILKGTGGDFEVLSNSIQKDFKGLAFFNGRIYVAADDEVFAFGGGDEEPKSLKIGYSSFGTYGHLHANDGVLWSFGQKNIFWTADGEKWSEITPGFSMFDPSEAGPSSGQSSCGCTGGAHKCD